MGSMRSTTNFGACYSNRDYGLLLRDGNRCKMQLMLYGDDGALVVTVFAPRAQSVSGAFAPRNRLRDLSRWQRALGDL